jgi:hypothetical protein
VVTENYPVGFVGLLYNADDQNTLELNLDQAVAAGATVTQYSDHIDVYQHGSPGVHLTFWGDNLAAKNGQIIGKVKSAELTTDPIVVNLSFGTVSGSLHAIPTRISSPGIISNTISTNVSASIADQFKAALSRSNLSIEKVAYTMDVGRINFARTGAANVTLTIPVSWVDYHGGKDSVQIVRYSNETGISELLSTVYSGLDQDGNMVFRGDSPNGSSVFGLLTVRATAAKQAEEPNVVIQPLQKPAFTTDIGMFVWLLGIVQQNPVVLVIVIAVIVLAIGGFVFNIWKTKTRTKKRREKQ